MRIVGGERKGVALQAPRGDTTRPTSDRARQAVFDMLAHAPWAGMDFMRSAHVLDAFAGTGALGLEALSRGAASVTFMEQDRNARAVISANIRACRFDSHDLAVLTCDVTRAPRADRPCSLVFLDPPYGKDLIPATLKALTRTGWIAPGAVIVAETAVKDELAVDLPLLTERRFGVAQIRIWRAS
ncbi:16S rRNA (guanine(966)-N(2))-methyltransferase RsmD [Asaia sp. VD9]|uniref:16S rRNA (guanine(966)-N(2))-methyltransferase RsmD n=1 Tax=Asaia sp. VD9 TaxID=3081235 RepID=UPI0030172C95